MKESKKFAFDVGITFIASIISMLLGFVITVFLGRYLGAGDLGLYKMASTVYGIAILFATIGIPAVMIKYVAENRRDKEKTNIIVTSGVITSLFLGIIFSGLMFLLSDIIADIFKMPELSNLLKILSPVFPFALVGGALLGLLNGLREMKKYGIATIIQSISMIIITIFLINIGFGVVSTIIGILLSLIFSCFYLILVSRRYFDIKFQNYSSTTKEMLIFGFQIFGSNAINTINYQASTLMIGYFMTPADVGYYGVAVALSQFLWLIPQSIQTITYPAISEYWANKNLTELQTMIDKSLKYTTCILLPIGLGIGFFAIDIIITIFGGEFIYSALPLQLLLIGTIINGSMQRPIGSILYSIGAPRLNLRIFSSTAIVNIILNLLLIHFLGLAGAAIATTISYVLVTFLILYYTMKTTKITLDFGWFIKIGAITSIYISIYYLLGKINFYFIGGAIIIILLLTIWFYLLSNEDKVYFEVIFKYIKSHLNKLI